MNGSRLSLAINRCITSLITVGSSGSIDSTSRAKINSGFCDNFSGIFVFVNAALMIALNMFFVNLARERIKGAYNEVSDTLDSRREYV